MDRPNRYGEEKMFMHLTAFLSKKLPPAESIGRIKEEFGICG
jgi:hypothetical protein